ncbi:MAG: WD40 repeat domain-containing protein, partial [Syntrophales bacterium]|nr:WD40 repeat domain-containing protein [Syntrophales bacterium]
MIVFRTILITCLAIFLSSCMVTPVLTVKNADMSRKIKQKAPIMALVDISPDGRYVLSGGYGSFILWDILQGKIIQTFTHEIDLSPVIRVVFSPDGKYFASGCKGTKLWDLITRKEITTFSHDRTDAIAFSPDGKHFLYGRNVDRGLFAKGNPPTMKIFDVATGEKLIEFAVKGGFASAVYSPDGKYVLSCGSNMTLWDATSGKPIKTAFAGRYIGRVAFSPDGKYVLSDGDDSSVILWNARNLTQIKKFIGHTGERIWSVAFSPTGKYALSAGSDKKIIIWDLASGNQWKVLTGHSLGDKQHSISAKFSPNGKHVISAGDASTRIWDVSTGEEVASMIAFEDGEWLFITAEGYYNASERGAKYWDAKVGDRSYSVDQFYDVFYRPDIVAAKMSGQNISGLVSITMQDAIKSPPPLVEFISQPAATDQEKMKVCYRVKNNGGGIGEVRLFHNGKLIQSDGYYRDIARSTSDKKTQLAELNSKAIYEDMRSIAIKGHIDAVPLSVKPKGDVFEDCKNVEAIPGENE